MKTLKITLMMLAVICMTMSGTSSDNLMADENKTNAKEYKTYDLIAHGKDKIKLPCNG